MESTGCRLEPDSEAVRQLLNCHVDAVTSAVARLERLERSGHVAAVLGTGDGVGDSWEGRGLVGEEALPDVADHVGEVVARLLVDLREAEVKVEEMKDTWWVTAGGWLSRVTVRCSWETWNTIGVGNLNYVAMSPSSGGGWYADKREVGPTAGVSVLSHTDAISCAKCSGC